MHFYIRAFFLLPPVKLMLPPLLLIPMTYLFVLFSQDPLGQIIRPSNFRTHEHSFVLCPSPVFFISSK